MADKNNGWYILGIILVAIILFKGGGMPFLESFVTTCTNLELNTLDEVKTHYLDKGATIDLIQSTPYVTQSDNVTITIMMEQNHIQLNDTSLILVSNSLVFCDSYIQYLKLTDSSELAFYNQKIATNFNGTYYWCNPSNSIILKGDISDFEDYIDEFIVCQVNEIIDEVEETEADEVESTSIQSQSTTNSIIESTPIEPDITKNRLMFGSIILLLVGLVYYFGYEKGPNKGLIRKKRR